MRRAPHFGRRAMTLIELMVASAIMAMVVGALAFLASAVQLAAEHGESHGETVQHARVVLERITRLAAEATANRQFPGMLVVPTIIDADRYPDTLVLWHPSAAPQDPDGLPRWCELVIYCPNPNYPNELVELTAPGDTTTVPAYDAASTWNTAVGALAASDAAHRVVLTNLVRVALAKNDGSPSSRRACVRFNVRLRPSDAEIQDCDDGATEWKDLPWVQNLYGPKSGLRQVWLRIELQLTPPDQTRQDDPSSQAAVPFFDSAAAYYTLRDED